MSPLIAQLVTHKPTPAMTELAERLLTEPYYSDFLQLYQPTVAHDAASVIYKTFDPPLAEGNTTGDDGFILVENWAY